MTFFLCAISLCASVVLGGGTHAGFLSDAVLQLINVPLAALVLANWKRSLTEPVVRSALVIVGVLVLIPLLQVVPLPSSLLLALGGDHTRAEVWQLLGQTPAWTTISVAPRATERAVLALFPSLVLFLGVMSATAHDRRRLSLVLVVLALISGLLGLFQLAGGPNSALRPFAFTNPFDPVGFFANRNHLASLLAAGALYALAWLPAQGSARGTRRLAVIGGFKMPPQAILGAVVFALVVLIVVMVATRSRAGVVLALLALGFAVVAIAPGLDALRRASSRPMLVSAVLIVVLVVAELSAMRLVLRFTTDALSGGRMPLLRTTLSAALKYLPLGAGVGTFTDVFPTYLDVRDEVPGSFANRAHNDLAESLLECGVFALPVLFAVLGWLALRAKQLWRQKSSTHGLTAEARVDRNLMRASFVIVALLLLHSLVDYPLRTSALASVWMMALAFMVPPLASGPVQVAETSEI